MSDKFVIFEGAFFFCDLQDAAGMFVYRYCFLHRWNICMYCVNGVTCTKGLHVPVNYEHKNIEITL